MCERLSWGDVDKRKGGKMNLSLVCFKPPTCISVLPGSSTVDKVWPQICLS